MLEASSSDMDPPLCVFNMGRARRRRDDVRAVGRIVRKENQHLCGGPARLFLSPDLPRLVIFAAEFNDLQNSPMIGPAEGLDRSSA